MKKKSKEEIYDSDNKNLGFHSVKCCALAPTFKRRKLGLSSNLNDSHPCRRWSG